jgi:archaellum biogenesis protein FlaJ (TadC family)
MSLRNIRLIAASILYFVLVFILLMCHVKFSGFIGFLILFVLGFGSHALVDFILRRMKNKFKGKDTSM